MNFFKIIFQNAKKVGPPRRLGAQQQPKPPPPRFPAEKFFGPPILGPIPSNELEQEVNLKRQTFIPIHATMPKTQLPVISTPKQISGKSLSKFIKYIKSNST
jgi:hypothetical protein